MSERAREVELRALQMHYTCFLFLFSTLLLLNRIWKKEKLSLITKQNRRIKKNWENFEVILDSQRWNKNQRKNGKNHRYHTQRAKRRYATSAVIDLHIASRSHITHVLPSFSLFCPVLAIGFPFDSWFHERTKKRVRRWLMNFQAFQLGMFRWEKWNGKLKKHFDGARDGFKARWGIDESFYRKRWKVMKIGIKIKVKDHKRQIDYCNGFVLFF